MDHNGEGLTRPVTDAVTGAYPRALLEPRMAEELARAARAAGSCSLFLFDVDFFKTVNDAYGHLRGDEVLRQLAERVRDVVRGGDALFRYGGDEFVLLLPGTGRAEAVRLALRLTDEIRRREFAGQPPLHLSVSLGVATFPDDADDTTALIACADRRNYLAKRRGRGGAVADDADTGDRTASSRLWERDAPMAAAQEFLSRLQGGPPGALRVTGEPGAGHTRFLSEVGTVARLRGYTVVTVPAAGAPVPDPDLPAAAPVLVLADLGTGRNTAATVERILGSGRPPPALGLVYTTTGGAGEPAPPLPLSASAELAPWSPAALRIWLRNTLQGEPTRSLVNWLSGQCGGLPARAVSELDRLRQRGGLVPTASGGWAVSPSVLGRPRRRSRLPVPVTGLVGRERERARAAALLTGGRLVTLVGPGGIGKTRLSLAVAGGLAESYEDGVAYVPLAEATDAALVVAGIAQALDIAEAPGQDLLDQVVEQLADAELLLVLDNFEQALTAAGVVSELLAAAPGVSALITSRERLSLYGEQVYPVPPLPLPDPAALPRGAAAVERVTADYPAIALFDQRARAADAGFALTASNLPAVVALCQRLEGLPLAIELAAASGDRLPPAALLADLADHLGGLGDGPRDLPACQQALRAAIDWSVTLLDAADQRLFASLAVFAGGWDVDAALAVADPTGDPGQLLARLAALAAKGLLIAESDGEGGRRYRMLETIHAHALSRLAADPGADAVRSRHAGHYAGFAQRAAGALPGPGQAAWAGRIDREYANLRAAFAAGDLDVAAQICLGLWRYWLGGSHIGEGRDWLDAVLARPAGLPDSTAAQLLYAAAMLAAGQDDHERAYRLATDGLRRAEAAGDPAAIARSHQALGLAAIGGGRYPLAIDHLRQSLAIWREAGQAQGMAIALGNLTKASLRIGDIAAADSYAQECLEIERAAGNTRGILLGLECLGEILLAKGDVPAARTALEESLSLSRALGDVSGEATALHQLGLAAQADGDGAAALRLFTGALARRHDIGGREDLAASLDSVAGLVAGPVAGLAAGVVAGLAAGVVAGREPTLSAQLLGAADGLRERHRLLAPTGTGRVATGDALRAALGERGFASAWAAGRAAPLDLIIDQVLDLVPSAA
jgi:diguanylate cyclase (GGDEF)-like protein